MRGQVKTQPEFLTLLSPETVVPPEHPLRAIKRRVDQVLKEMNPLFNRMYAEEGRPSIPPERLLKAKLLIALYSVRSETLFCEQLGYNLLFRWFLDMDLMEPTFVQSAFSNPRQRGSASMKSVLPALTGEGYEQLEIQEGASAAMEFRRVTFGKVSDAERTRVRRNLEAYCAQDTLGMVKIV